MSQTTLDQSTQVLKGSDGTVRFLLTSTISQEAEEDLPHGWVFVHLIDAETDPKADTFLRIGTIADLTQLPRGRGDAVRAKEKEYLSRSFTVNYPDVHQAIAAKDLIRSRIDSLIDQWKLYRDELQGNPRTTFPLMNPAIVEARTADHQEASTARAAAEALFTESQREVQEAEKGAERANAAVVEATQAAMRLTEFTLQLREGLQAVDSLWRTAETFAQQARNVGSTDPDFPSQRLFFERELAGKKTSGPDLLRALLGKVEQDVEVAKSELMVRNREKVQADIEVGDAKTAAHAAERELQAAVQREEETLAKAVEVCPTYRG